MRLAVTDEGAGIDKAERGKVFERFYRLDNEETLRAPGTGLGLPIAKALTELHGGKIELRSGRGRGSTFVVTLPALTADDRDDAVSTVDAAGDAANAVEMAEFTAAAGKGGVA